MEGETEENSSMAAHSHIWSRYGVDIDKNFIHDDVISPEEAFQNMMFQFSQHFGGKRIYILEKIGPDNFTMTHEWKVASNTAREIHSVFSSDEVEKRFPGIWEKEVVETPKAYAALLKRYDNVVGLIVFEKEKKEDSRNLLQTVRLMGFFVSTLLYSWKLIGRLHTLGYIDVLTGVGNFNSLLSALDHLSDEESLGVIFADVSGLKQVNDNFGHEAGNELLKKVTGSSMRIFPKQHIFRVGGDEFIILEGGVEETEFSKKVRELRLLMKSRKIDIALGSVWVPEFTMDFSVLKNQADRKMYEEKRSFYQKKGKELPVYQPVSPEEIGLRVNCDIVPSPFFIFEVERDKTDAITNIRIKVANKAFADLFGMRPEEWTDRSILPLLNAADQPVWSYIHKMANEKENVTFRVNSQCLKQEMMVSMKMTSSHYGTLVMMPVGPQA
jgi:diguanylate cyclase (GGDEF)-like protein